MLFALAYAVVRFLLEALIVGRKPDAKLQAEVLALRHQLRVLERQVSPASAWPSGRILRRRGFIDCAAVRHPGPSIDQGIVDDLEEALSLLDIRQRFDTRRAAVRPS